MARIACRVRPLLRVHVLGVPTEDGFVPDFRESDVSGCDRRIGFGIVLNRHCELEAGYRRSPEKPGRAALAYAPVVPEQVSGSISTSLHREHRGRGMH